MSSYLAYLLDESCCAFCFTLIKLNIYVLKDYKKPESLSYVKYSTLFICYERKTSEKLTNQRTLDVETFGLLSSSKYLSEFIHNNK